MQGTALRRAVRLDVQVRRDSHGLLGGWLRYMDTRTGARLALHQAAFRSASTSCGPTPSALIAARLRAGTRAYDASLSLSVDKRHAARFTMRLLGRAGRATGSYTVAAALSVSGRATITCLPPPAPHKPAYKPPARTRAARTASHSATTGRKAAPRTAQGQGQGGRKAPAQPPRRAPSH